MQESSLLTLDTYRLLGNSGLRVSPLCLGTMTFGTDWNWGADKDTCRKMFDLYLERGGNFIDTANLYTNGTSEEFVGEFLEGRRDEAVLATKYTLSMRPNDPNAAGNQRKNLQQALEASLKRLKTDHIDLYYVHAWDGITPIDEVMRALDDAVAAGKILYAGVSDFPAWKVAQANTLADMRGWSRFIGLQIQYSLVKRTVERDLIPMAKDFNIGVLPWGALAGGILTGKYEETEKPDSGGRNVDDNLTERNRAIIKEIRAVAGEIERTPSQVAHNWLLQRPGVTSIILGARKLEQLEDNLASLEFKLDDSQIERLNDASAIEMGFPTDFLNLENIRKLVLGDVKIEM
ncbi:MAG: aldo/keto reductase [Candidatus Electryonea clarkiae]|nr:aldo/keto reductase [Candidatus Electryonea clarkiae]MDP8288247.1 aldo/keto reductase [Candidatus Electryonea clarkiae]